MLYIKNKYYDTTILDVLYRIRAETKGTYLKDIKPNSGLITCPFHGNHSESHPSCGIGLNEDSKYFGSYHCFTCGSSGMLDDIVSECLDVNGEQWLKDNYGNIMVDKEIYIPEFKLADDVTEPNQFLDESILNNYNFYHPYMWKRKLSKDVVDKFDVGYDKERQAITFPVYDEKHRLVMITARSVLNKRFYIPSGVEKPVYLLYDLIENKSDVAYVCESQINALVCRTYGRPGIALFGTGSNYQYNILKQCGIKNFVLLFDGDIAGRHGAMRFRNNMPPDTYIVDVQMYRGRDVADLSKDEFDTLLKQYGL